MTAPPGYQPGARVNDSALLRRIADTVAIMLYEMEVLPDGSFSCHEFVGLETLIGPVPEGMTPDDAYDAAVDPRDREAYDRASAALHDGSVEVEYRLIGADGSVRWVLDRMCPEVSSEGRLLVGGVVADITDRKSAEAELLEAQKLAHIALHDPLTGLPNRFSIEEHLALALERAKRSGAGVALMFIDLDDFKLLNDSFGHAAGDELLREVSVRLRQAVRRSDVVARQSGDEFLILLPDLEPNAGENRRSLSPQVESVAGVVRRALRSPFLVSGIEIFVSASVGISLYPNDADDATTLLKHADVAMYEVKEHGRDGHGLYARDAETGLEQISMASRLHRAVDRGRGLVLHYQPLVRLDSGQPVGVEALLRWEDGTRGLIAPGEFIPLAERTGLIGSITDWVIDEACRQLSVWRRQGRDLYMSVNLPPSYCQTIGINHLVHSARTAAVELERLMIEITESALLPDGLRQMEENLAEMSRHGLKVAIDDFGTGYSSLGRLNHTWVNMLKIDRSFVQSMADDTHARRLVSSVIQLARTLELEPLAEGVETEAQRRLLLDDDCTFGQGFLFSEALPVEELEPVLDGGWTKRHAA
jgi:diguanylate cyclase (GGDEF)-like protein/PAS domain S-box-containing protein